MKKKYFLLLAASACLTGKGFAQQASPCGTDEMHKELIKQHPEILKMEADFEAQFQKQVRQQLTKFDFTSAARTTADALSDTFWYDIPIVVHIIHDYNDYNTVNSNTGDYIKDDMIFESLKSWNRVYAKQNADTIDVIAPFKKYIGNPHIRLHLATKDPNGNPTKGITRRRNYLTYTGGQQAKFDDWPASSYVNIWFVAKMGTGNSQAAAYAHKPADAAFIPFYDGVISLAEYLDNSKTINHEIGHCFNLDHVWGGTNQPEVECGDDNVDDTPPTKGHNPSFCAVADVYDTVCSTNYFKIYTDDLGAITLVNYPDTNNAQNIMDYTYCDRMFTKGQVQRMHTALNSTVAGRSNLWSETNLSYTGALAPMPDLKPIPDFTIFEATLASQLKRNANFVFPGVSYKFKSQTYNDTVIKMEWSFSNGATKATDTTKFASFNNAFTQPGWATITMKATGNNSGDSTRVFDRSVFVADDVATNVSNYLQEFNEGSDRDKWVSFNYYNNEFKWQLSNKGMYDNTGIMYTGFDSRLNTDPVTGFYPLTGSPKGDFDDLFSVPVDLSSFSGSSCNLNFWYSAASRSTTSVEITDTIEVAYSANKGAWTTFATLGKSTLVNKGAYSTSYAPSSPNDWAPMTLSLPAPARVGYVTFRFRYRPGAGTNGIYSTGNNFYMDRVNFSQWPAELTGLSSEPSMVSVVPNPTHGNAYIYIKDQSNSTANVVVTDVTGKVVYTTSASLANHAAQVEIPRSAITVPGMYLVQTATGANTNTQKLVVY